MKIRQELVDALELVDKAQEHYDDEERKKYLLSRANVRLKDCERHVKEGLIATSLNVAEEFIYDKLQIDIDVMW